MSSTQANSNDLFTQKTDTELLYFLQHPDLHHPDVVAAARQELHRRGVVIQTQHSDNKTLAANDYVDEPVERRWLAPSIGGALLVVGLLLYTQLHKPSPAITVAPKMSVALKSVELKSVELNVLPTFEVETAEQLKQEPILLPADERTDKKPLGKYLILAGLFWKAENQADFLANQVAIAKIDSTFPEKLRWYMINGEI